ncbi:hypothetical protein [Ciceribacter lividus]|uniref:hypothetical protein n=1 Tax=Ciceribacter lividus TaxID=1197950 RepID=UPI0014739C77|nr:hypothetical protein [Ciceribacter lividus]
MMAATTVAAIMTVATTMVATTTDRQQVGQDKISDTGAEMEFEGWQSAAPFCVRVVLSGRKPVAGGWSPYVLIAFLMFMLRSRHSPRIHDFCLWITVDNFVSAVAGALHANSPMARRLRHDAAGIVEPFLFFRGVRYYCPPRSATSE